MIRSAPGSLCVGLMVLVTACGEAPAAPVAFPAPAVLQHVRFTAVVDPSMGRFQIVTPPQAAISLITQDHDGNPSTVATSSAQIYGASVRFASGGVGYPSACNTNSPMVMFSSVDILSGYTEQLRNVYVRITSVSGGQTFCGTSAVPPANIAGALNPNRWLYTYPPLDGGDPNTTFSSINRSLTWGLQLPNNSAFWFDGELWAEVIPQPPTIKKPVDGEVFATTNPDAEVVFLWTVDAAGSGSAGGTIYPTPNVTGTELTILRCNANSTGAFNAATCSSVFLTPTIFTKNKTENKLLVPTGYWYQWSARAAFTLPGRTTDTIGTLVTTGSFRAGN